MLTFVYTAKNEQGVYHKGLIEASDERQAAVILRQNGLVPVEIKTQAMPVFSGAIKRVKGVPHSEVVNFTRQLSTMITAGLNLPDALTILSKQTANQSFREILSDILRSVEGGVSLATAMEKHPKAFSQIYVSLVRAGETAGVLDTVLARLAENLEKARAFKSKAKGAMVYPMMVLVVMAIVMVVIMVFVVPKLNVLFTQFEGSELPLPTVILIGMSDFLVKFVWLIAIIVGAVVFFVKRLLDSPEGKDFYDKTILKVPLVGSLKMQTMLAEFTRTFGLLIGAGIPILEALKIVSKAMGNSVMENVIQEAAFAVERGRPLAENFSKNPLFPPILGQMIRTGEETGKLDEVMGKVSFYFESEADEKIKALTTMIEPAIIVVLAFGVVFLLIAVILPIYSLTNSVTS